MQRQKPTLRQLVVSSHSYDAVSPPLMPNTAHTTRKNAHDDELFALLLPSLARSSMLQKPATERLKTYSKASNRETEDLFKSQQQREMSYSKASNRERDELLKSQQQRER